MAADTYQPTHQMRRIVEVLGLPPSALLDAAPSASRDQFFDPATTAGHHRGGQWRLKDGPPSAGGGAVPGAPGTRALAVRAVPCRACLFLVGSWGCPSSSFLDPSCLRLCGGVESREGRSTAAGLVPSLPFHDYPRAH